MNWNDFKRESHVLHSSLMLFRYGLTGLPEKTITQPKKEVRHPQIISDEYLPVCLRFFYTCQRPLKLKYAHRTEIWSRLGYSPKKSQNSFNFSASYILLQRSAFARCNRMLCLMLAISLHHWYCTNTLLIKRLQQQFNVFFEEKTMSRDASYSKTFSVFPFTLKEYVYADTVRQ